MKTLIAALVLATLIAAPAFTQPAAAATDTGATAGSGHDGKSRRVYGPFQSLGMVEGDRRAQCPHGGNRRQIEQLEARQREREKREAAEIEVAKERDRQAYRERGWPSG
jgi:hypothetical protein